MNKKQITILLIYNNINYREILRMKKTILCILLSINLAIITGCGTTNNSPNTSSSDSNSSTSSPITATSTTYSEDNSITNKSNFRIIGESYYICPFIFNGTDLLFSNPDENNRISIIPDPLPENILDSNSVKDFIDYSSDNIGLIGEYLYFSNSSDNNNLYSCKIGTKEISKINNHSVDKMIIVNNLIYYTNKIDNNKLYVFDAETLQASLVTSDSVGQYIVNGDYIIYQNLSDNSKLYSIKFDCSEKQKLTDYTANSFITYKDEILFFNSSDNNNLYSLSPETLKTTRLKIMNGSQLQTINDTLYFINGDDINNLYSLSIDSASSEVKLTPEISFGINYYYLTPSGIFYSPSINVNNIHYKPFSNK